MKMFSKIMGYALLILGALALVLNYAAGDPIMVLNIIAALFIISGILCIRNKRTDRPADDPDQITSEVTGKMHAVKYPSSNSMVSYSFNVAGVSYRQKEIIPLLLENDDYGMSKKELIDCNMTDEYIYRYTTFMRDVELVPDPGNEHDPNAIKVLSRDVHVGFVPADKTGRVRKILESGSPEISAEFRGGPYKIVRTVWDDGKMDDIYELERDNGIMGIKVTMKYEGL